MSLTSCGIPPALLGFQRKRSLVPACPRRHGWARPLAAPAGRAPKSLTSRGGSPAGGRSRSGGFTLLELLLAFMVFALSFATVLEIMSGSMRNTVKARQFTEAALTAQSVMDQLGLEIPLETGFRTSGEAGAYRWEIEVFDYEGGAENPRGVELAELTGIELLQVDLAVSWGEPPREQTRHFSTIKALLASRQRVGQ